MTPDQREKLQLIAERNWIKLGPGTDPVAFIAELLLELAEPPRIELPDDIDVSVPRRPGALFVAGPYNRPSDRRPNDGLDMPPLPVRKQMERAAARAMIEYESRETNALAIVEAVLDVLQKEPIPEPKLLQGCLVGADFVRDQFRRTIQAIRRGE